MRTKILLKSKNKESSSKKENILESVKAYLKGVKSEWGKIAWPEKNQIIAETLVVLGVVCFFTLMVYILDKAFCFGLHPKNICEQCLNKNPDCSNKN